MTKKRFRKFLTSQCGATAIEYALIAALIFLVILASVQAVGSGVKNTLYGGLASLF
jgi:Flp pilus assembly pilin Flp